MKTHSLLLLAACCLCALRGIDGNAVRTASSSFVVTASAASLKGEDTIADRRLVFLKDDAVAGTSNSQFAVDFDNVTTSTFEPEPTNHSDDDGGKKGTPQVRGEVYGIILSAAGFVIVAAMTTVIMLMARKKKKQQALLAEQKKMAEGASK